MPRSTAIIRGPEMAYVDVHGIVSAYSERMARNEMPKLFIREWRDGLG